MVNGLPIDACALQDHYGAALFDEPGTEGQQFSIRRAKVAQLCGKLPCLTDTPQARRKLGGMPVNTTTNWVDNLHDTDLLDMRGDTREKERQGSGSWCVIPTRDLVMST